MQDRSVGYIDQSTGYRSGSTGIIDRSTGFIDPAASGGLIYATSTFTASDGTVISDSLLDTKSSGVSGWDTHQYYKNLGRSAKVYNNAATNNGATADLAWSFLPMGFPVNQTVCAWVSLVWNASATNSAVAVSYGGDMSSSLSRFGWTWIYRLDTHFNNFGEYNIAGSFVSKTTSTINMQGAAYIKWVPNSGGTGSMTIYDANKLQRYTGVYGSTLDFAGEYGVNAFPQIGLSHSGKTSATTLKVLATDNIADLDAL